MISQAAHRWEQLAVFRVDRRPEVRRISFGTTTARSHTYRGHGCQSSALWPDPLNTIHRTLCLITYHQSVRQPAVRFLIRMNCKRVHTWLALCHSISPHVRCSLSPSPTPSNSQLRCSSITTAPLTSAAGPTRARHAYGAGSKVAQGTRGPETEIMGRGGRDGWLSASGFREQRARRRLPRPRHQHRRLRHAASAAAGSLPRMTPRPRLCSVPLPHFSPDAYRSRGLLEWRKAASVSNESWCSSAPPSSMLNSRGRSSGQRAEL